MHAQAHTNPTAIKFFMERPPLTPHPFVQKNVTANLAELSVEYARVYLASYALSTAEAFVHVPTKVCVGSHGVIPSRTLSTQCGEIHGFERPRPWPRVAHGPRFGSVPARRMTTIVRRSS